ncbi:MAG: translation initiation factor IF-2 [Anaeromyxobacter sp.]
MAVKNRPGAAKEALGKQEAGFRRGAPGKKFIGDTAPQREAAKRDERERVERMAEVQAATRRAEELGVPVEAVLAELAQDFIRLLRSLSLAPFRLAQAWRRGRARRPLSPADAAGRA